MWDLIRKAILAQKIDEVKGELQRAGAALNDLLMDPDLLKKLDNQTVWQLLHGLDASFTVLERTLRTSLSESNDVHPDVRKNLREVQAAVATLRESLTGILPYVEALYQRPATETRWKLIGPEEA